MIVPGVSGLRLASVLALPYGLIFGRMGAVCAALGAGLGMLLWGGSGQMISMECLGSLLAAYLPYRVWQGMHSVQEPFLCVTDGRTGTMFFILCVISVVPKSLFPALGGELYMVEPFPASYWKIFLCTMFWTVVGGGLFYHKAAAYFFRGPGEALWTKLADHKTTTRRMAVAMLRITLTGGFVSLGLSLIFPNEFSLAVVRYVTGIFGIIMMILTAV
jgi:energy-coupling factor transport system substrate-specific component